MTYEADRWVELKRPVGGYKVAFISKVELHDPDPFKEHGDKYPPYTMYTGYLPGFAPIEFCDKHIKKYWERKPQ